MKLLITLALLCAASAHLLNDAHAALPDADRMPDVSALRCNDDDVTGAGVECVSFEVKS